MAFCSGCGTQLPADAKFCGTCGQAINRATGGSSAASVAAPAIQETEPVKPRIKTVIPDFVRQALHPAEPIFAAFSASLFDHRRKGEFRHDKFVLTSERIIYYHTALIHKGMGEMPYKTLTGVSYNKGLIHGKVVVEAAGAGLTIDGIGNDDAAFAEKIIAGSIAGRKYALAM